MYINPYAVLRHDGGWQSDGVLMSFLHDQRDGLISVRQLARAAVRRPRVPAHIRERYLPLTSERRQCIEQSLRDNFFADGGGRTRPAEVYLQTPEGREDFQDHVSGRLAQFRTWIVPWLDSLFRLDGARVLEIGCGTGASSVALAEQGAEVVGVDISAAALATARDRCAAYGLHPAFVETSATRISSAFAGKTFDAILFFAVLEHLTWEERIVSLRAAWELIPAGKIIAVIEAPNRLWYVDIHTTDEPFYHWLPDEAAIAYTRYTHGPSHHLWKGPAGEATLELARLGRGVSYHEFVIAWDIAPSQLPVVGHAAEFHENRMLSSAIAPLSTARRYRRFLARVAPDLHPAFLQPSLDVAFRKAGVAR